jgi:hypothetical protein
MLSHRRWGPVHPLTRRPHRGPDPALAPLERLVPEDPISPCPPSDCDLAGSTAGACAGRSSEPDDQECNPGHAHDDVHGPEPRRVVTVPREGEHGEKTPQEQDGDRDTSGDPVVCGAGPKEGAPAVVHDLSLRASWGPWQWCLWGVRLVHFGEVRTGSCCCTERRTGGGRGDQRRG